MSTTSRDRTGGRLDRHTLDGVLRRMSAVASLDPTDAQLIKFTNNAVFRLPRSRVVMRVAGSTAARARVDKVVAVARWLVEHQAPAVRLVPGIRQPLQVSGHVATIWREVPAVGPAVTGADLAAILGMFHQLPAPSHGLPAWNPLTEIRQRLAEPEGVPADDLAFLHERCDAVEASLAGMTYGLPPGPIHGDAFLGNLIPGSDGPVICDFDSTSHGPREWDLTPVAVGDLRFRYGDHAQDQMVQEYGFDVTTWTGFAVLRQFRELKLVTSVVPILRSNPSVYDQWRYRMDTFRRGDLEATWITYA